MSAFTRPENRASARVLRKAGFRRVDFIAELERDRYSISACDWKAGSNAPSSIG